MKYSIDSLSFHPGINTIITTRMEYATNLDVMLTLEDKFGDCRECLILFKSVLNLNNPDHQNIFKQLLKYEQNVYKRDYDYIDAFINFKDHLQKLIVVIGFQPPEEDSDNGN